MANVVWSMVRSAKNSAAVPEAASSTNTFANSEGCSLKGPTSSQRVAPFAPDPATRTTTSMPMMTRPMAARPVLEHSLW